MGNSRLIIGLVVLGLIACSAGVFATPYGLAESNTIESTRNSLSSSGTTIPAQAGNTTVLNIKGEAITEAWAGYYGNITGEIILDNSGGTSMYEWSMTNPQGEVYAVNDSNSVSWAAIECVNLSSTYNADKMNLTRFNTHFGITTGDDDDVSNTFKHSFGGSFDVAGVTIDSNDECYSAMLYNGSGTNSTDWQEVLLTDDDDVIIFAAIIAHDRNGFDNSTNDFQMIVAENGQGGDTTPTNYYFYVELE